MQYIAETRRRLESEGLPTEAHGARIHVLGEPHDSHATPIVRVAAGPLGLARGAEVEVHPPSRRELLSKGTSDFSPETSLEEALRWGEANVLSGAARLTSELEHLLELTDDAGSRALAVATISWSTSPLRQGWMLAEWLRSSGPDTRILEELGALSARRGAPPLGGLEDARALEHARCLFAALLTGRLEAPQALEQRAILRERARAQARALRERNILVVACAGNLRAAALPLEAERRELAPIPEILLVGAATFPVQSTGWEVLAFSARGADILAPGGRLPIGGAASDLQAEEKDGTSFSTPYVGAVAALAGVAGLGVSADRVAQILLDPRNGHALRNPALGPHVVDAVRVVRQAREG